MINRLKRFLKEVTLIIRKPIMGVLPGQLAFSFILTIIPLLAILGLVLFMFSVSIDSLAVFVKDTFPSDTSKMLLPLIQGKGFDISMLAFILSAFFLASGGAYSIIITSNLLYQIDQPSQLKRRIKSFLITIILLSLICFLILVPAFGDYIMALIRSTISIDSVEDIIATSYLILKYPISFIIIYFNIKLIYTVSPDRKIESSSVTRGALFTTILWIILSQVYSYYATHIIHYDIFYGSLSNIIILFLWMYLLSYIFVIGLALNAENNGVTKQNK